LLQVWVAEDFAIGRIDQAAHPAIAGIVLARRTRSEKCSVWPNALEFRVGNIKTAANAMFWRKIKLTAGAAADAGICATFPE